MKIALAARGARARRRQPAPHQTAARAGPRRRAGAARLLRRLVTGEIVFVVAAVFAAAVLSSLAAAVEGARGGRRRERPRRARAGHVGRAQERLHPRVRRRRRTRPRCRTPSGAHHARRQAGPAAPRWLRSFAMLDMEMGTQAYRLTETAPGTYAHDGARARDGRALGAVVRGHPARRPAVHGLLVDRANG